jgi:hypothetical protein
MNTDANDSIPEVVPVSVDADKISRMNRRERAEFYSKDRPKPKPDWSRHIRALRGK